MNVSLGVSTAVLMLADGCLPAMAKSISDTQDFSLTAGESLVNDDDKALSIKNPTNVSVNIGAGALISGSDDAIHGGDATSGTVSITNSGTIESTAGGQAIDLNDFVGPDNTSTITNNAGGLIKSDDADGIRPGANATVINAGTIYADGATGDSHDGIDFQDAPTGTVINEAGGLISGKRHGITGDGYTAPSSAVMTDRVQAMGTVSTSITTPSWTITGPSRPKALPALARTGTRMCPKAWP